MMQQYIFVCAKYVEHEAIALELREKKSAVLVARGSLSFSRVKRGGPQSTMRSTFHKQMDAAMRMKIASCVLSTFMRFKVKKSPFPQCL